MKRRLFLSLVMICTLVVSTAICSASDTFQMIYEDIGFTDKLANDTAWKKDFNTDYGEIKLQVRKVANAKSDKKIHLMLWLDKDKLFDQHYPDGSYTFRAIKDSYNNKQFYVLQSASRSYLIGYSPINKKMEIYIDSQNFYNNFDGYPYIVVLKNGNLILAFESRYGGKNAQRHRYRFTWDDEKNWFAYTDLGTGWETMGIEKQ